jgi:hypothetical protein
VKIYHAALACGFLALGAVAGAHPVQAQGMQFPDVPANHWAYQAVTDLANEGYVKGYPDGKFLGNRTLTRYEFATVIDRIVQTLDGLNTKVSAIQPIQTPTGTPVTQDDLNKIQALVDNFGTELTTIQSNIGNINDQLDSLRQDVQDAKTTAHKALTEADSSYGAGADRKFTISGFVQARYEATGSGSKSLFPPGTSFNNGAYNGSYDKGDNSQSFFIRRARIQVAGALSDNTKYAIQIDTSGPNSLPVTVRNAYGAYTFGNGDSAKNLTVTAGEFANPFGYELFASATAFLSPERPLGFNEGGAGIWNNEDYVIGAQAAYNLRQKFLILPSGLNVSVSAVNPNGRSLDNTTRHVDSIYRVKYQTPNKVFGIGASYYDGEQSSGTFALAGGTADTFREPKKRIYGLDGQLQTPAGLFMNAEYEAGLFESRSYFNSAGTFVTDPYVKNNQIGAYYVQGGWTFNQKGTHPLTLAASYDALYRSHSAQDNSSDSLASGSTFSSGGASYDDTNLGYGVLYNLDKATRLKLWYEQPFEVAHAAGAPTPQRVGLFTTELQVKF